MARNSKIILCKNIKLDREYNNVINYTEEQMVTLCRAKKVVEGLGFSFIRTNRNIKTPFTYEECLGSNYIAFQNPDYSNKWFFAWIDEVIYKADGLAEISYTIDSFATWFNKGTIKQCFVVREHVSDDTIGLHTVPENVEMGEYINNIVDYFDDLDEYVYVLQATETLSHISDPTQPNVLMTNFGGVPMARLCLCYR